MPKSLSERVSDMLGFSRGLVQPVSEATALPDEAFRIATLFARTLMLQEEQPIPLDCDNEHGLYVPIRNGDRNFGMSSLSSIDVNVTTVCTKTSG